MSNPKNNVVTKPRQRILLSKEFGYSDIVTVSEIPAFNERRSWIKRNNESISIHPSLVDARTTNSPGGPFNYSKSFDKA